ncbi:MAG: hypothetical protein KJ767_03070 [Nanoarchaeota archaeon]|nr:hypothetical protein [Nanoarchaeota archaeon]
MNLSKIINKDKKAQIFSIDATIGAFLVAIIILAFFINISKKSESESLQLSKVGYDMLAILDYGGLLANPDETAILTKINETLPNQYEMRIRLEGDYELEAGSPVLQRFVASGKRVFVNASENDYGIATFWIWLK